MPTAPTLQQLLALTGPVVFVGKARNLAQRLDALKALAEARVPSQQDVSA